MMIRPTILSQADRIIHLFQEQTFTNQCLNIHRDSQKIAILVPVSEKGFFVSLILKYGQPQEGSTNISWEASSSSIKLSRSYSKAEMGVCLDERTLVLMKESVNRAQEQIKSLSTMGKKVIDSRCVFSTDPKHPPGAQAVIYEYLGDFQSMASELLPAFKALNPEWSHLQFTLIDSPVKKLSIEGKTSQDLEDFLAGIAQEMSFYTPTLVETCAWMIAKHINTDELKEVLPEELYTLILKYAHLQEKKDPL